LANFKKNATKILFLLVLFISACNDVVKNNNVVNASSPDARPMQIRAMPLHLVQPGETLFSIAKAHNLNWQELASFNNINEPYLIFVGQTLQIAANPKPYQAKSNIEMPVKKSNVKPPAKITQANSSKTKVKTKEPNVPVFKDYDFKTSFPTNNSCQGKWVWPAKGELIRRYSANGANINKGIDISNTLGTPVLAAADGLVSYAGVDIKGYGQTVVIKHNDVCVSVYGHNHKILVNNLEEVKAGQIIAEMGNTSTDQVKLHFEIHAKNNAVDPLLYLPKK